MGYSNFKRIQQVTEKFSLDAVFNPLFDKIKPVKPSPWLKQTLEKGQRSPAMNEKAKAERIISPVLMEVAEAFPNKISFFSGEEINVDAAQDLAGPCDFFFALHPPKPFIDAPIISLVEAKNEDMEWGIAQCAGQMYAASVFNQQKGKAMKMIYGCATTGTDWQFMRYEDKVFTIDMAPLTHLPEILGAWHQIIQQYL